ncbi:uncharacterized protein [Dysidea avara]|uniref:uncharacterized protein isoform X2 n=1 Tax=Dysidea avara TaxID=196820 RepID=UPI003318D9DB
MAFKKTAHNAPMKNKRESGVSIGDKTQQFYCTSQLLKLQVQFMVKERKAVLPPTKHSNKSSTHNTVKLALQQFDFTCSIFTSAMAIKYQLQNSLFKGKYFITEDNDLVTVNNTEDIIKLTSVLEHLQTLTSTLQNIEETLSAKQCIVFSPSEYRRAYCEFFDEDNCVDGTASVLKTLKNMNWNKVEDYPMEWQDPLPQYCLCTGSCFT